MPLGPIELVIVDFPDEELHTEIVPSIKTLVASGTVRVADLVFLVKGADGAVKSVELADVGGEEASVLDGVIDSFDGLLSVDDIDALGEGLDNGTSALIVLFENTWAAPFVDAVKAANGAVIFNERIPRVVIEDLMAETEA
jgi:uncharacterized membrane protein